MQSTCHCHSMWLLPCYADSGCLIGCLFCCKVQELSMFHVLKVGGTRNTTVPTPQKKKHIKKRKTFCRLVCVCVGRYQPPCGTSFQLALTHRNFYFVTFSASYETLPYLLSLSLPFCRLAMRLIIRRIRVFTQFSIDSMELACAWLTRSRSLKAFKFWWAAMKQCCHEAKFKFPLIM